MKFTLNWLKEFLDTTATAKEIYQALNSIGLEVEEMVDKSAVYAPFIIAEILEVSIHPDAEKLRVCKVNNGKETLQIVCGAPNARAGIKVVLAPIGTSIPANGILIKQSKIRGVDSQGMLCSNDELSLAGDSSGIIELDAKAVVGTRYADYVNLNDVLFELSITPNRGDAASVQGIAFDLAAKGLGKFIAPPLSKVTSTEENVRKLVIEDTEGCEHFAIREVRGLNNNGNVLASGAVLRSVGSSIKTALVDISNYAMLSLGRPSHFYDDDKVEGTMVVRKSKADEKFIALGGEEYTLPAGLTVIADSEKILCIAGVIGGELSKVDETTKNIIIEVANFTADVVTKAGRALNINTDSRFRFERRIDFAKTEFFVEYLSALILKTCGGKFSPITIHKGGNIIYKTEIDYDYAVIKRISNDSIDESTSKRILESLGFTFAGNKLKIPSARQGDVEQMEDIAEEVLRIHGFDNIKSAALVYPKAIKLEKDFDNITKFALNCRGLTEVVTWSFSSAKIAEKFGFVDPITLANPISIEFEVMRQSILPNLLGVMKKNIARSIDNFGIFEIGNIYFRNLPTMQKKCIAGIRFGKKDFRSVYKDERTFDFYDAKRDLFSIVEELEFDANKLGISTENLPGYYHPYRACAFVLGKNATGYAGEIHPDILKFFDTKTTVTAFEIFVENLPKPKAKLNRAAVELSDFQPVIRDFAFMVDDNILASDLIKCVKETDPLIESAQIFDVYTGSNMEPNQKSVALSARLQPKLKTMTEEEINAVTDKICNSITVNFRAVMRG